MMGRVAPVALVGMACILLTVAAIARDDGDVLPAAKILAGACCELAVELHADNAATGFECLCCDGGVVADAATNVEQTIPGNQSETVEPTRQSSWLSVVEVAARIQRDQHIVVEVARIGVWSGDVATPKLRWPDDLPGPWTHELLTRD